MDADSNNTYREKLIMTIKIICWNIQSLKDTEKVKKIHSFISIHHPDIIILVETWRNNADTITMLKPFGQSYAIISTDFQQTKRGVAILFKKSQFNSSDTTLSTEGWFITTTFHHLQSDNKFSLTGLYSPSGEHKEREDFLRTFFSSNSPSINHIVVGDFNACFSPLDEYNTVNFDSRLATALKTATAMWCLEEPQDEASLHFPTWFQSYHNPFAVQKRIDYLLATPPMLSFLSPAITTFNPRLSDHCPLIFKLTFNVSEDKPRWRLDNRILEPNNPFQPSVAHWAFRMSKAQNLNEWLQIKNLAISGIKKSQTKFSKSISFILSAVNDQSSTLLISCLKLTIDTIIIDNNHNLLSCF